MTELQSAPLPASVATARARGKALNHCSAKLEPLLRSIAAGDKEALTEFYNSTRSLVFGLTLRMLRNPADAEEVALEVYAQVWKKAATFDPARSPASAWLVLLTRSRALDRLRSSSYRMRHCKQSIQATVSPELLLREHGATKAHPDTPLEAYFQKEQHRRIRAAIERLSPGQQLLVELAFFSGHTHSELAGQLGQPLGTVKTRLRVALRRLRDLLQAERGLTVARAKN
jgi:RNA polymerase sigma-70 factor (ECF subfamily)